MLKKTSSILVLMTLFMSFMAHSKVLNSGPWRFELQTTYGKVPFIINLKETEKGFAGVLHNGKEQIPLKEIILKKNHLTIPLQTYEMTLEMSVLKKDIMTGFLVRHNKNPKVETPIMAVHGVQDRYTEKLKAPASINGRWSVTMTDDNGVNSPGVLIFEQNGNSLHGSLLTTTGDYRFFEGYISGEDFEVACFDGVYNYIIRGKVKKDKIKADIRSSYLVRMKGKRNDKAELPDAYAQTKVEKPLTFKFSDLSGKLVSLDDKKFAGKPVIVQFYGSWCPNCMDEMNFLIPWYKENKKRGIEIVALAFERSLNNMQARAQLKKTQKKKGVPYTLLLAGSTSEEKPMDKIPGLKNFISFPTTVFLNKKHEVVKVHAGFTGPGTGEFFETWKKEFNETVDGLLK